MGLNRPLCGGYSLDDIHRPIDKYNERTLAVSDQLNARAFSFKQDKHLETEEERSGKLEINSNPVLYSVIL